MSAIDTFLERNARVASGWDRADAPVEPAKRIAVLLCMDTRLSGELIGLGDGEAHLLRNAGGIASDDVLRSLTISQRLLGTREVMVVQHTRCGMTSFTDDELAEAIERDTGVRPPFALGSFPDLEKSVRDSVARIQACPFLPHTDVVRGFVFEVETGRLREVG
jgi:carbonic anhydrase